MGKNHSSLATFSKIIALSGFTLLSPAALAIDVCDAGGVGAATNTISSAQAGGDVCILDSGDSVVITNSGSLTGNIYTPSSATTIGSIQNAGSIITSGQALSFNGTLGTSITNSGTITGSGEAILFNNTSNFSGGISNLSGGILSSTNRAITFDHNSSIDFINNEFGATIHGDRDGISLYNTSSIRNGLSNSGSISGDIVAGIHLGGGAASTIGGGLTNSGTISGEIHGIELINASSINGGLSNSGTISGKTRAISLIQGSAINGGLINSGTISSNDTGIYLNNSSIIGGLTNSGTISAINYAINITNSSNVSDIFIEGNNAHFIADVLAQDTALTIKSGANFSSLNAFNVKSVTVENGALFNISLATKTALMNNGISVSAGFNNDGITVIDAGEIASINGDYSQTANGLLRIGATSNTHYGKLNISGTANLTSNAKIDVDVTTINTLASDQVLAGVLTAASLTSDGTFTISDNSALLNFTGRINGNSIDLAAVKSLSIVTAVTNTGKKIAEEAAKRLDDLADNGTGTAAMEQVLSELRKLSTQQQVADAVESTLPSLTGGVALATNLAIHAVDNVITLRQDSIRGLSSGDGILSDRHLWFKPFANFVDQDDQQGVTGYGIDSFGLALGIDGDISPNWNVGLALSYLKSNVDSKPAAGYQTIDIDSYQAKLYASRMLDEVTTLKIQVGVGRSDYQSKRRVFTAAVAKADYNSWNAQLSAELARSYTLSKQTILTPYIRSEYNSVDVDSYKESNAGALNLNVSNDRYDSFLLGGGLKTTHHLSNTISIMANAGIAYDLMTERSTLTSSFSGGGAKFNSEGIKPEPWLYNAGLGIQYNLANGSEVTAHYSIDARQDYTDQTLSAKLRYLF